MSQMFLRINGSLRLYFSALIICFVSSHSFGQIMIDEPVKELGDIFESQGKITTYFDLKNPYRADTIHILNIETSCGCTAILTQDTVIYPGQTLKLEVSYDPQGRPGLFVKSIAVETRTGKNSLSTLYLKISGNVISETQAINPQNTTLLEYKVSPIYFYAVTAFDTSYLDFSYVIPFVNDLTYEIDYYQFTTIGFEIGVADKKYIKDIEITLKFIRKKLLREFKQRGYFLNTVFFDEPIFKTEELPAWSTASIKVYSSNFNNEGIEESSILVSSDQAVEAVDLVLDYQRFVMPAYEEILQEVNFEKLEGKLFMNGQLDLRGILLTPSHINDEERTEIGNQLAHLIYKKLKKSSGISKDDIRFDFDSTGVHPENKYRFVLWDKDDEKDYQQIQFVVKDDQLTPPLLPTYKQSLLTRTTIDTSSQDFILFWSNLCMNYQAGFEIEVLMELSISKIPRQESDDNLQLARKRAKEISDFLTAKFLRETGGNIRFIIKPVVHGPDYSTDLKKLVNYAQYEYVNLVPTTHKNGNDKELNPHPYQVNFDYYFNGVDTSSWLFDKFARYLAEAVEQDGYVELRLESSISKVPVEHDLPNNYLVYRRAHESEQRLRKYMNTKLIDENRVIFTEHRYLTQGPEYDGTIPILEYRIFQYVKIVPQKYLTQE